MNIFDWHEDKTPEELAKELGIDNLSVVKNTKKDTITNLWWNSNEKNIEWTEEFEFTDLIELMPVIDKLDNTEWYIISINTETKIITIRRNKETDRNNSYDFVMFKQRHAINKSKEKISNIETIWRTDPFLITDLEIGMKIKEIGTNNLGYIREIDKHWNIKIIRTDWGVSNYAFKDIVMNFAIEKTESPNKINNFLDEKYLNNPDYWNFWMWDYEITDLMKWNRVKTISYTREAKCGIITNIVDDIIYIEYSNEKKDKQWFDDFLKKHKLFTQDFAENHWKLDCRNGKEEAIYDYRLENLHKGMKVVDKQTNKWYYIIDIRYQKAHPNNIDEEDCTIIEIWNKSDDYRNCVFDKNFVNQYILYTQQ